MEAEVMLGKYSVSFILTIMLTWLWSILADDPATISNRLKRIVAVLSGIALSILSMFYQINQGVESAITLPMIVDYTINGFLIGCAAIGINQLMKSQPKYDVPQVTAEDDKRDLTKLP